MNPLNIYLNVKQLAFKKGMNLGDVEAAIGVSTGYLSRGQKHRTKGISVSTLIGLAEVLNVSVEDLLNDPPVFTNADKFEMVFGITPKTVCDPDYNEWWNNPFQEPDEVKHESC